MPSESSLDQGPWCKTRARRGAAHLLAATRGRKFPRKAEGKEVQKMKAPHSRSEPRAWVQARVCRSPRFGRDHSGFRAQERCLQSLGADRELRAQLERFCVAPRAPIRIAPFPTLIPWYHAPDAPALASSPSASRVALRSPGPAVPCPRPGAQTWLSRRRQ